MRKALFVITLSVLVIVHLWFASQFIYYQVPEVNAEHEAFSLEKEKENVKLGRIENVMNYTFRFDKELLDLSGSQETERSAWSILDVSVDMNIPLRRDLKLSFSIYASQLNVSTDSAYVSLTLTDGANVILASYYLGYPLPEWKFLREYYVSLKVSETLDRWIKGERNLWDDLVQRDLPLTHSMNVAKVAFGVLSYRPSLQFPGNAKMQALFNASENSLFFEASTYVKITTSSYQFPMNAVFLIVLDLFFFVFFVKLLKMPIKSKNNSF